MSFTGLNMARYIIGMKLSLQYIHTDIPSLVPVTEQDKLCATQQLLQITNWSERLVCAVMELSVHY